MTSYTNLGSDVLMRGPAFWSKYNGSRDNNAGVEQTIITVYEPGAIATLVTNAIYSGTSTATGTTNSLTLTGANVTSGVATFAVPQAITINATGDASGLTFTIAGTDLYAVAMTEAIIGATGTSAVGVKAFLTVSSVSITASTPGLVQIGGSSVYGLPVRAATKGKFLGVYMDGGPMPGATLVAGLAATGASTATTADVRGTWTPTTAANATRIFSVMLMPDPTTTQSLFGTAQA